MPNSSSPTGYTAAQIALHWIVALMIVAQYLLHDGIEQAFSTGMEAGSLTLTPRAIGHMIGGGLILLLMIWRLVLKRERGLVPAPAGEPAPFQTASKMAHGLFYAVLILLPISGAIAWGGASQGAANAHGLLGRVLFLLMLIHIAAVLVHQFYWKTGLFTRMTRPER